MPLGMEVGLGPGDSVRWGPSFPSPKGAQPPIFGQCPLWPNGWMDYDATWYGGTPRPRQLCVRWGPSSPQRKGTAPHPILADVSCGETAGWIKIPLGTEINLSPGDVVLDGVAAPPKRGTTPQFSAHVYCGQTVGWMQTPLGTEVDLGPGHVVRQGPSSPRKGQSSPLFSAHVYCGHCRPSQLLHAELLLRILSDFK